MPTQQPTITPELAAILEWGRKSKTSLDVQAYAGCGKTTAGVELCKILAGSVYFVSFGKAIAVEIENRLGLAGVSKSKVEAATFHSLGFRAWKSYTRANLKPDADKCSNLLSEIVSESKNRRTALKVQAVRRKNILQLVSFAKLHGLGIENKAHLNDMEVWIELAQRFGIDEELSGGTVEDLAELAIQLFDASLTRVKTSIDYDDQLYAPLFHNVPFVVKDTVIVDEGQDTSPTRRLMAQRLLRPNTGRLVVIGDRFQSIMRFAGADSDAMDIIKAQMKSESLALSVTYRCAKAIVHEAQHLVPGFAAHESAPEGSVREVEYKSRRTGGTTLSLSDLQPGQAVLCRNTRPLVELLYDLLEAGRPVKLEGSTPLQAYISLVESMDTNSLLVMDSRLRNYCADQTEKWDDKPEKLQRALDKAETVWSMSRRLQAKGVKSVDDLLTELRKVFESDKQSWGVVKTYEDRILLSTIHKAKGREWDTVYILGANLFMPSKYAKKQEDKDQERNLEYVAITRAKNTLVYINCRKEDFGAGVPADEAPLPASEAGIEIPESMAARIVDEEAEELW